MISQFIIHPSFIVRSYLWSPVSFWYKACKPRWRDSHTIIIDRTFAHAIVRYYCLCSAQALLQISINYHRYILFTILEISCSQLCFCPFLCVFNSVHHYHEQIRKESSPKPQTQGQSKSPVHIQQTDVPTCTSSSCPVNIGSSYEIPDIRLILLSPKNDWEMNIRWM